MQGEPIPQKYIDAGYYGDKTHYSRLIGIEYAYGHPHRYDGVSEWMCPDCGYREGRWSGRALAEGESEPRFGGDGTLPSTRAGAHTILEKDGDGPLRATPALDKEGSAVACAPRQLTVDDFPELWT